MYSERIFHDFEVGAGGKSSKYDIVLLRGVQV